MNGYNIYTKIKIPRYSKVAVRRLNNQHIQQNLVTSCLSFRRKQKLERTSKLWPSFNYFHFSWESLEELLPGQAAGVLPWLLWLLWNKKDQTEERACADYWPELSSRGTLVEFSQTYWKESLTAPMRHVLKVSLNILTFEHCYTAVFSQVSSSDEPVSLCSLEASALKTLCK